MDISVSYEVTKGIATRQLVVLMPIGEVLCLAYLRHFVGHALTAQSGLTPAPADSGFAAAGTHLVCEEYNMLARRSVHPAAAANPLACSCKIYVL